MLADRQRDTDRPTDKLIAILRSLPEWSNNVVVAGGDGLLVLVTR